MSTPIAQNFDSARASMQKIKEASGEGEIFVKSTLTMIENLGWQGAARLAFNTVSEDWAKAVLAELARFTEFAEAGTQVVNEQELAESSRAQGASVLETTLQAEATLTKEFPG
ncbi:hypothetical protein [Streptomyces sp. NPDC058548]|uniref:hypothetical protein n=1 Tax=unclassified Streptomyces TaxID=2593676 RepID=UPI00364C20D6